MYYYLLLLLILLVLLQCALSALSQEHRSYANGLRALQVWREYILEGGSRRCNGSGQAGREGEGEVGHIKLYNSVYFWTRRLSSRGGQGHEKGRGLRIKGQGPRAKEKISRIKENTNKIRARVLALELLIDTCLSMDMGLGLLTSYTSLRKILT